MGKVIGFPPEPLNSLFYDIVLIDALGEISETKEKELRELLHACKVFIEKNVPGKNELRENGEDPCSILYNRNILV